MAHCESKGSKCQINRAEDFNIFCNKLTGGFISVQEEVRPDHLHNPTVMLADESGNVQSYTPPTAKYLQYSTSKPVDWQEPTKVAAQIGHSGGKVFKYGGGEAKW
jgi:hypothetical protein